MIVQIACMVAKVRIKASLGIKEIRMMNLRVFIVAGLGCLLATSPLVAREALCQLKAPASEPPAIEAAYKEMEAKVVAQLKDPAAWTDEKRKERTAKLVEAAGAIRSQAAVPILVEHLTWSDLPPVPAPMVLTLKEICPPIRSLALIGLPAAPELIKAICGPPPDRSTKEQAEAGTKVAMMCLFEVYQTGGMGREMALHRIALEAQKHTGEEKDRLNKALKMFEDKPESK
jgi:hypothetical protein